MLRFFRMGRAGLLVAFGLLALGLAGCSDYGGALPKHMRPLDSKTRDLVDRKNMDQRSPILIRIFKEEAALEVWKLQKTTGRYAFLKEYEICAWSGVLGPKIREGDRQAPEGFYTIRPAQMNPDSDYYLAFNMGYPNEFDRSLGRTGSELMVHGACSSRGCYSMTDESIQEIYTLGRLAFQGGQRDFQVQAFPFRMTPENMARHRNDPNMPFWLMLKEGYDHFELTGQPPKVDVCDRRYIFDSVPANGQSFIPTAQCPAMSMPEPIRIAVEDKEAKDNAKMLLIADRLDRREGGNGAAALQLAFAIPTSADRAVPIPMSVANAAVSFEPATTASVPADMTPAPVTVAAAPAPQAPTVVASAPASDDTATLAALAATPRIPRPAPEAPPSAAAAPQAAPTASAETEVLPLPKPRKKLPVDPDAAATVEERMLAGSAEFDIGVTSSYASAESEDEGTTGMVLRLIRK